MGSIRCYKKGTHVSGIPVCTRQHPATDVASPALAVFLFSVISGGLIAAGIAFSAGLSLPGVFLAYVMGGMSFLIVVAVIIAILRTVGGAEAETGSSRQRR